MSKSVTSLKRELSKVKKEEAELQKLEAEQASARAEVRRIERELQEAEASEHRARIVAAIEKAEANCLVDVAELENGGRRLAELWHQMAALLDESQELREWFAEAERLSKRPDASKALKRAGNTPDPLFHLVLGQDGRQVPSWPASGVDHLRGLAERHYPLSMRTQPTIVSRVQTDRDWQTK